MILIALITLYVLLVSTIAGVMAKRSKNLSDFFLAGKTFSARPIAFSFVAGWFGAGSTLGSVNAYHDHGLSALFEIAIPSLCSVLVITLLFAKRVNDQGTLSQPEAVSTHYGKLGRFFLTLIILCSITCFIASQAIAGGQLLQKALGLDITTATITMTGLVVLYSVLGGYFAVVLTDICQFILFTAAVLILAGFSLFHVWSNPEQLQMVWQAQHSGFWDLSQDWPRSLTLLCTFVLAWSIAPEMWQRMSSTQTREHAFQAASLASVFLLGLFTLVFTTGLLSPSLVQNSKTVLLDIASQLPNDFLIALVLLGITTAITSTMDSSISVGSLALSHDLYRGFIRPAASDKELLWISRLATVLIPIPAICIALYHQDILHILWASADIYASTMFFPIIGILFFKAIPRLSGILAMLFGGLGVLIGMSQQYHWLPFNFYWPEPPYSTLVGVLLSGVGFGLGFLLKGSKTGDTPTVEGFQSATPARF